MLVLFKAISIGTIDTDQKYEKTLQIILKYDLEDLFLSHGLKSKNSKFVLGKVIKEDKISLLETKLVDNKEYLKKNLLEICTNQNINIKNETSSKLENIIKNLDLMDSPDLFYLKSKVYKSKGLIKEDKFQFKNALKKASELGNVSATYDLSKISDFKDEKLLNLGISQGSKELIVELSKNLLMRGENEKAILNLEKYFKGDYSNIHVSYNNIALLYLMIGYSNIGKIDKAWDKYIKISQFNIKKYKKDGYNFYDIIWVKQTLEIILEYRSFAELSTSKHVLSNAIKIVCNENFSEYNLSKTPVLLIDYFDLLQIYDSDLGYYDIELLLTLNDTIFLNLSNQKNYEILKKFKFYTNFFMDNNFYKNFSNITRNLNYQKSF